MVAIAGDGGFKMSMHELATAEREQLSIIVLVLRNGLLGEERARQQQSGYRGVHAMALRNPDFAMLAQSFGAQGLRAQTEDELSEALRQAFGARRPVLVDIQTAYVFPPALRPVAGASVR